MQFRSTDADIDHVVGVCCTNGELSEERWTTTSDQVHNQTGKTPNCRFDFHSISNSLLALSNHENFQHNQVQPDLEVATHGESEREADMPPSSTFMHGLWKRLRPMLSMIGNRRTRDEDSPSTDPSACKISFDQVSDLQWLGSGAQGAVFRGEFRGRTVAVKKVRDCRETSVRQLLQLNHHNVVRLLGVCTDSPYYCIIMEYCQHGSLHDHLRDGKQLSPGRFMDWSTQVGAGMRYLHDNRIIHRDLKSANILFGEDHTAKISDFGTCRDRPDISMSMSFAGTVAWMAPEVIRNEPYSEKVDVWSFGVVLWEMLTGDAPYRDVDSSAIIWGVGNESLHLPIPHTAPTGIRHLIEMCWSATPAERPSFPQVISRLEAVRAEVESIADELYSEMQIQWRQQTRVRLDRVRSQRGSSQEEELIRLRREELQNAQQIRALYERRLEQANNLYLELNTCLLRLEQQQQDISQSGRCKRSLAKASNATDTKNGTTEAGMRVGVSSQPLSATSLPQSPTILPLQALPSINRGPTPANAIPLANGNTIANGASDRCQQQWWNKQLGVSPSRRTPSKSPHMVGVGCNRDWRQRLHRAVLTSPLSNGIHDNTVNSTSSDDGEMLCVSERSATAVVRVHQHDGESSSDSESSPVLASGRLGTDAVHGSLRNSDVYDRPNANPQRNSSEDTVSPDSDSCGATACVRWSDSVISSESEEDESGRSTIRKNPEQAVK